MVALSLKKRAGAAGASVVLISIAFVALLASLAVGYSNFQSNVTVTQMQSKLAGDETAVASLTSQLSSLQSQLNSQQPQTDAINRLQASISSMQSSLQSVQSQVQSLSTSSQTNGNQISQIQNGLKAIQTQVTTIQSSVGGLQSNMSSLQPQTPISTLVITQSSFNSSSGTESFVVQNTWNGTVNAQLQVFVRCVNRPGDIFNCPNPVGTYTSQVIQFAGKSTSNVSFKLSQVEMLSSGNKDQLQVYFVSANTQVSQQYTFQYPS